MGLINKISVGVFLMVGLTFFARAQEVTPEQHDCGSREIIIAGNQYDIGKFTECIDGLKECIGKNGFEYNEKLQAYRLMAMSYLAMDSVQPADKAIESLLTIDDNFEMDVRDPQRFKLQVAYIRTKLRANLTSSVSKKMENIDLAPATIQIITSKDIQDRGYIDLESIFNDLPGFDISRNFGISYSVLYQRGYRSPALTERTMIMIDGIEDNDLWTNAAFVSKQYPISSVKRVEIIYGPASTIYGANAFCGVINVVTKEEDDIFGTGADNENKKKKNQFASDKPANLAVNVQGGYASYNTRYVDGTIGIRNKSMVLTVTGRLYKSDGIDLSSQSYWDGTTSYTNGQYTSAMTMAINKSSMTIGSDSVSKYIKSGWFKFNADSTKIVPTSAGIKRADSIDQALYKTAKPNAGSFTDPMNDYYVAAKLSVHNFKLGFQFWNRSDGSVGDYVNNYAAENSAYTNWQVREYVFDARYEKKISDQVNITSLTYYRFCDFGNNSRVATFAGYGNGALNDTMFMHGILPKYNVTNYYEQSNMASTELKASYVMNEKLDFVAGSQFKTGLLQANYLTTSSPGVIPADYGTVASTLGGNNYNTYTLSGYATASYHDLRDNLNVDLGARADNNVLRQNLGYGTVLNPRVDLVWFPSKFVFKAIYATAFLDASDQNKFSTASTRKVDDSTLSPERVKNYEVSARYKFGKHNYVELVGYRAHYTNSLAVVTIPYLGGFTTQYQDIGQSLVYGLQAASEIFVAENISVYANATYTDPKSILEKAKGGDSVTVRTGDIAAYSGNAGINIAFLHKKLNLNTRINIVGNKPTGATTSINTNPLSDIPGFYLLNATLGYRIVKNVLWQFTCNNILNVAYYSPGVRAANGSIYAPEILQPSRSFITRIIVDLKK